VIRYVALLRRRAGTTRSEFLDAWLGEHRRLAGALPRVRLVEFTPTISIDGSAPEFDGVGFLEFDSLADLQHSLATPDAAALRIHTATFADSDAAVRSVVDTSSDA
jgi:uncharacterized protein (TIGR02118 family)